MASFFFGSKPNDPHDTHKRQRLKHHLPVPTGLHTVAIVDVMTDAEDKQCFFRLFHPTEKQDVFTSDRDWPLWFPSRQYAEGITTTVIKTPRIISWIFNWFVGRVYIPGLLDGPLLQSNHRYPLILFSHGLMGNRIICTNFCMELASRGFVVAALEHRDGSASMTYSLKKRTSQVDDPGTDSDFDENWIPYEKGSLEDFEYRNGQMYHKARECQYALDVLTKLDRGDHIDNQLPNTFDYSQYKNKLDLTSVAMVGHSFGGSACLGALHLDPRFKVGVLIDGWLFPIDENIYTNLSQPLLFINSDTFHWKRNLEHMERFMDDTDQRKIMTIKGTCHMSVVDFPLIMNKHLAKMFKLRDTLEPATAMKLHVALTVSFLRRHLDIPGETFDNILTAEKEHIIPGPHLHQ